MSGGCTCARGQRRWLDSGSCEACGNHVLEGQLAPVLLQILCGGTGLALWPNPQGFDEQRKVRYGLGTGSGDYVGIYRGRYVEVELKTSVGRLSDGQKTRQQLVGKLGGIYAVVRNETQARALLAYLESLP